MRTTILFIFLFTFTISYCQNTPTNVILTDKQISGNADKESVIKIDINNDAKADYTIVVNYVGYFEFQFPSAISTSTQVLIWAENESGKTSPQLNKTTKTDTEILSEITSGKISVPLKALPIPTLTVINPQINEVQPASTTFKFKTTIINTNFTIPVARFNTVSDSDSKSKVGDIILFNSIGAGFGISGGELERTTNSNNEIINSEFTSSFAFNIGVLFSAGSGVESKNVFAPTVSFGILDFQIGYGYELGTMEVGQKRDFWTIAYAIPLSKLIKGKFYVIAASKGYNSKIALPPIRENESTKNTEVMGFY